MLQLYCGMLLQRSLTGFLTCYIITAEYGKLSTRGLSYCRRVYRRKNLDNNTLLKRNFLTNHIFANRNCPTHLQTGIVYHLKLDIILENLLIIYRRLSAYKGHTDLSTVIHPLISGILIHIILLNYEVCRIRCYAAMSVADGCDCYNDCNKMMN